MKIDVNTQFWILMILGLNSNYYYYINETAASPLQRISRDKLILFIGNVMNSIIIINILNWYFVYIKLFILIDSNKIIG